MKGNWSYLGKKFYLFFFLVLDKRVCRVLSRLVSCSQGKFFSSEGLFLFAELSSS